MSVTTSTVNRHLVLALEAGQTAAGKPKLQNRAFPHVDTAASDDAISTVLTALAPLFSEPVAMMGHVDTIQIVEQSASTASASGSATKNG